MVWIGDRFEIDDSELEFDFSRSGGPGGQHANKASTKAALLFDVKKNNSLRNWQKKRVIKKLGNRINKEGILRIECQEHRSQKKNRDGAVRRFQQLMEWALRKPKRRKKTRPPRWVNEKRLRSKKRRSEKKMLRKDPEYPR